LVKTREALFHTPPLSAVIDFSHIVPQPFGLLAILIITMVDCWFDAAFP
jgi:hypothetical protein